MRDVLAFIVLTAWMPMPLGVGRKLLIDKKACLWYDLTDYGCILYMIGGVCDDG